MSSLCPSGGGGGGLSSILTTFSIVTTFVIFTSLTIFPTYKSRESIVFFFVYVDLDTSCVLTVTIVGLF